MCYFRPLEFDEGLFDLEQEMFYLAIVVGHDEKAKGALAVSPLSLHEYDYNTELAALMYRYAKGLGVMECKVFLRDGVGIEGCYKQVNDWLSKAKVGCAIELHFNSSSGKARGTETLVDENPRSNFDFAREIQDGVCAAFDRQGRENRGIKVLENGDRGHRNLSACRYTSCLIEGFFGDNPLDARLAVERKFSYAKSIVEGALRFFKAEETRLKNEDNLGLH